MRRQQEAMGLSFDKNPQVRNRILCAYCHLFHLTEDLVNGLCPKFAPYALELQKEHSYECAACGGEGSFERRTETKILENQKKYEQRWKEWMEKVDKNPQSITPVKRVIKVDVVTTELICDECHGQGVIFRMVQSNKEVNLLLNSQKLLVNPMWIKYRMKSRFAERPFQCSICLMDGGCEDKNFKLICNHEFHYSCIFKWLQLNDKCPICRHADPFLDLKQVEENESSMWASRQSFNLAQQNQEARRYNELRLVQMHALLPENRMNIEGGMMNQRRMREQQERMINFDNYQPIDILRNRYQVDEDEMQFSY